MKRFPSLLFALAAAALPLAALAQGTPVPARPFLSPLFTDNMVLQRGMSDPVWGWATPGATVTVRAAGKGAKAVAGPDGEWMAKLPPLPVGGPYTMHVSGPQSVTLHNVLVGDVWVCSGQSNMQFGLGNAADGAAEIAAANHPTIRLFFVPNQISIRPRKTVQGSWEVCTPQNVRQDGDWNGFSAVGYLFGRDLSQNLHVPIGLLHSSVGGTPAEAWTSAPALATLPDFKQAVAQVEAERSGPDGMAALMAGWYKKNDPGDGGSWQSPTLDDSSWDPIVLPGYFQNAGVPALAHVNGIVWFRRTFTLPAGAFGKDLVLHLLADDNDTTWVNGTQVGATEGYATPRAYTIPAGLLRATGNVIAVRVLDTGGMGGLYGAPATLSLTVPGGAVIPLAGLWHVKLATALTQTTPLPQDPTNSNTPTVLYNGMINPLIPFGIKGVIWYQGESNEGRALQYRSLLPAMIGDWRARWGQGAFPFLIVQLAGWEPAGSSLAQIRQAQWLTAQDVPDAGIATAVDIGDAQNIHPTDKQDVGKRLALVAEAQVYHEKVQASGPVYRAMTVAGGTIRLTFRQLGGGLVAKGGGALTGFQIAGADKKWVTADAALDGNSVVVSSPQVPHPLAVRYAWAGYPACSLYNRAGLPAFPFRTDDRGGDTLGGG